MINYYMTLNGITAPTEQYCDGCWINVSAPSNEELMFLTETFALPEEFLRSSLDEEELSHIVTEEDKTLIVIDVPYSEKVNDGVAYFTMPVGIIITPNNIITVTTRDNPVIREITDGVVKGLNTTHRTQFVLYVQYRMATRYLQYLNLMDRRVNNLEKLLRQSMRNKELIQLLDMQKSLVYFHTSLKSNEVTLGKIMRNRNIKLYEDDQDLLEDVMIEIKQAIEMSSIYLNILSGTMDAFASVISNNLNIVMKVLTSLTIVMAIPTMIFSFYGMNIGDASLPFAGNIWFPLIFSIGITSAVTIFLYFKGMLK